MRFLLELLLPLIKNYELRICKKSFFLLKREILYRCKRLGLTSLAYLWNRDQKELLKEMIDNKMNSVIIKTASYGLKPETCLGRTIEELYPLFLQLVLFIIF